MICFLNESTKPLTAVEFHEVYIQYITFLELILCEFNLQINAWMWVRNSRLVVKSFATKDDKRELNEVDTISARHV